VNQTVQDSIGDGGVAICSCQRETGSWDHERRYPVTSTQFQVFKCVLTAYSMHSIIPEFWTPISCQKHRYGNWIRFESFPSALRQ